MAGECIQSHRNNDCVVCPGITDGTLAFGCKEVETESMSIKLLYCVQYLYIYSTCTVKICNVLSKK